MALNGCLHYTAVLSSGEDFGNHTVGGWVSLMSVCSLWKDKKHIVIKANLVNDLSN